MTKLAVLTSKLFTLDQCRINFDKIFVFGDNCLRVGMAGQAIIREQKNAVGIATKKSPSEYFSDVEYNENCKIIDEDIKKLHEFAKETEAKAFVFPFNGLGTGLSSMQTMCPKTFFYLGMQLLENFGFNNVQALRSN